LIARVDIRKRFFFEKKNQKTFVTLRPIRIDLPRRRERKKSSSSEKEESSHPPFKTSISAQIRAAKVGRVWTAPPLQGVLGENV
jgi:hypothetical protein